MWYSQFITKGKDHTHLLLSGGKLSVSQRDHGLFLNLYANAVLRKEDLYIVESKTPVFRLFVDFDFQPPQEECIVQSAVQTFASIAGYYFDTESKAVVLRKTQDTPDKVGVHMTWDNIFVTPLIAKAFRTHVVDRLIRECSTVDWQTVVDVAVYGGSGLRMPWSRKRTSSTVYRPVCVVHPSGKIEHVLSLIHI